MVKAKYLALIAISLATFGLASAVLQPFDESAKSTQLAASTTQKILPRTDYGEQVPHEILLFGRTNGEEYGPVFKKLKARPFDDFGAPDQDEGSLGAVLRNKQRYVHPAPLRTIVPSLSLPPLHPNEPKPLPGNWDGEITLKKPLPSRPKLWELPPRRKKKAAKKQFPNKHTKLYKGYQKQLHKVQHGGIKKPIVQRVHDPLLGKLRRPIFSQPRRPQISAPSSRVSPSQLSPRGGTWSSIELPFKKRPHHDSSASTTISPTSTITAATTSPSSFSSTSSAGSTSGPHAEEVSSFSRVQSQPVIPSAQSRILPWSANRPPLHPNTPRLPSSMRVNYQSLGPQADQTQHFGAMKVSASPLPASSAEGSTTPGESGKHRLPFRHGKKHKGRHDHQGGVKKKGRFTRRSYAVDSRKAAWSVTSGLSAQKLPAYPVEEELLRRAGGGQRPSSRLRDARSSSPPHSPCFSSSLPESSAIDDTQRLTAQFAALGHSSPPRCTLNRAASLPENWDSSIRDLLLNHGMSPSKNVNPRRIFSARRIRELASADRVTVAPMRSRRRQARRLARHANKEGGKQKGPQQSPSSQAMQPRLGKKLFPTKHPKTYKEYRSMFHTVQAGRIDKTKHRW